MSEKTIIERMVDRFLGWKLPTDFVPDCYITFDATKAAEHPQSWPVGTNLFTAIQAKAMFQYALGNDVEAFEVKKTEPRFFLDHGMWHDRVMGQHMFTQAQYDEEFHAAIKFSNENAALRAQLAMPIDMVLLCPMCATQHIDAPDPERGWTNPPHKSHLCHACGTIWRPADVATYGVMAIKTKGQADNFDVRRVIEYLNDRSMHQETAASADDAAVDHFAEAMKEKLARKRDEGRSGWNDETQCEMERLAEMLVEHVPKGDPVDIANFCMMLHQRERMAVEHHPCHADTAISCIKQAAGILTPEGSAILAQAAPVLLAALKAMHQYGVDVGDDSPEMARAAGAIAKALGQPFDVAEYWVKRGEGYPS